MNKETASRLWVELNLGEHPEELKHIDLSTHKKRWEEMQRLCSLASESEVNRLWNERHGITNANVGMGMLFGNQ